MLFAAYTDNAIRAVTQFNIYSEIFMKTILLSASLLGCMSAAHAVELVCKGYQPQGNQQRTIYIDCTNRKAVIDALGGAWRTLRQERIRGTTEDMCWKPYKRAEELHPSIPFDNIATTFFMECNMALQFVK